MNFTLEIIRFSESDKQTLSKFIVFDDYNCELAQGFMLELPDRNNETGVSRINEGEYDCVKRISEKYGNHFHILNVEDRSYILIHVGNYYTNTRGCLLPGDRLVDINNDGLKDVVKSGKTMKMLNELLPEKFKLVIKNQF
jgi:hypothetical protein